MKITDLEPKLIWQCFDEITKVARPTHHMEKMNAFLMDWAKRHNIEAESDAVGNVVMRKPAIPGHEDAPGVILQGHQDMVAEKNGDKEHDFLNDPITTIVDGDWVRADGTTLGADNGLGCAAGMAVLLDDKLVHGPIECLFTVDEEQGLVGANGLQPGFLKGSVLLNLDSEEHGTLVIGCAGGVIVECEKDLKKVSPTLTEFFSLELKNFKGGHSGMEINLGRGNATQQMCRFLWELSQQIKFELADINTGGLANAIPREAVAKIAVAKNDAEVLKAYVEKFNHIIKEEYKLSENPDIELTLASTDEVAEVICDCCSLPLISAVFACPNGVQGMSLAVEGLVETSCNVASIKIADNRVKVTVHVRSSVDTKRDESADRAKALFSMLGYDVKLDDAYAGWAPNPESKVLKVAEQSFEELFGKRPKVEALHAGLECGLFLEKMPDLDMVSFGPTLKDIHSPAEKANIPSVKEFWIFLCDILTRLA